MDKASLGYLVGKPHFECVPRELRDALDALDTKCQQMGITPVAFIALASNGGVFVVPMASMSDAEAKSLKERFLSVVADAPRESDDTKKLM
jgi:hypothetical protein